jgi:periplasmic protein TonB
MVPAVPPSPVLVPPKVIAQPGALYPGDAFRLTVRRQDLGADAVIEGSEGIVTLRALVLATGDVRSVEVTQSSGSGVLDRAAAETVRRWRFAPATRDGAPIDAYVTLRIRYVVR